VQQEEPREIGDDIVPRRQIKTRPARAHLGQEQTRLHHRRYRTPGPGHRQPLHRRRRAAGANAAAVSREPTEGDCRRRATRLCPATPMAAAVGWEGAGGGGRGEGCPRRPGTTRRRRARVTGRSGDLKKYLYSLSKCTIFSTLLSWQVWIITFISLCS
jgi:hypothetical protein